ncbi:MAG: hypothetical protein WAK82_17080, partial [Streptosporangiaceae bacterium]
MSAIGGEPSSATGSQELSPDERAELKRLRAETAEFRQGPRRRISQLNLTGTLNQASAQLNSRGLPRISTLITTFGPQITS